MSAEQNELLRHAVLEVLGSRPGIALPVGGIVRRVRTMVDFKLEAADVEGALAVLEGLKLVEFETDTLGSSKYWKATAAGVLHVERMG